MKRVTMAVSKEGRTRAERKGRKVSTCGVVFLSGMEEYQYARVDMSVYVLVEGTGRKKYCSWDYGAVGRRGDDSTIGDMGMFMMRLSMTPHI